MALLPGVIAAAGTAMTAPYLAGVTVRVPDRDDPEWWRGRRTGAHRVLACGTVGAACAGLAGVAAGWTASWPAFLVAALVLAPLAVIDIEHHRLPDRLVLTGVVAGGGLLAVAAAVEHDWTPFAHAVLAGVACFVAFLVLVLASPQSLGLGDAKLVGLLGLFTGWLSWSAVVDGLFIGVVLGGAMALIGLISGRASWRSHLPLGPALIAGAWLAAALHTGF